MQLPCGAQRNQTLYAELMKNTGKSFTIENCHWGRCTDSDDSSCPTVDWCPFNVRDLVSIQGPLGCAMP